jgi:uncharacterized protein (DUF1684 family)
VTTFDVLDWRRQTHAMYAAVRADPDAANAHAMWIRRRDELLKTHPASPVPHADRASFAGADVPPYDGAFRFVVPIERATNPEIRDVATGTDGVVRFERVSTVDLPDVGALDVWWLLGYGGGIFVPIRDRDPRSYGGGRYVIDTVKGADLGGDQDSLVVDLNFAYQPSCAYDPEWACPLAGAGNTVAAAVPVGEKYRK